MPVMRMAGHERRAITYLMGNNVIAETMFRHDPGIILYAPLRTAIYWSTAPASTPRSSTTSCGAV